MTRMWKFLKRGSVGIGIVAGGIILHTHNYDLNSLGVVRFARACATGAAIGIYYKVHLYGSKLPVESAEYEKLRSNVHYKAANMLLNLCCTNKGVYVKVGQHVGALDYLVPAEYIEVMKVLHSKAPASTFEQVLSVMKEDLKRDPYDVFSHVEETPIGAASLAQVHKAVLRKDGSVVAVKVQHPLVLRNSLVDMKTMEVLVNVMSYLFKEFNFQWLVDETKRNLPKELDFRLEAANAETVQRQLKNFHWLKIPRVYWSLTTQRVLTMEFEEGGQVNDLAFIEKHSLSKTAITELLGEMYAHMIFKHGFVHSDPHPGNILLQKINGQLKIVLLDHGLYAILSKEFKNNYSKLWMSILKRDLAEMKAHSTALGINELFPLLVCMVTGRTWQSVTSGIDKIEFSVAEKETFQREIPQFLTQIGEVLERVNRELLLVLKTNDLLRGIEFHLQTHEKQASFLTMTRCCIDTIFQEKVKGCSQMQRIWLTLINQCNLCKIKLYSIYLNIMYWIRYLAPSLS